MTEGDDRAGDNDEAIDEDMFYFIFIYLESEDHQSQGSFCGYLKPAIFPDELLKHLCQLHTLENRSTSAPVSRSSHR